MADAKRQILVTAALPYVNGHIHLGHLVEYIQAGGADSSLLCALSDAHNDYLGPSAA